MEPEFIPGLELNRRFFQQIVKPLIDKHFPDLKYAAGLVGEGSDVLGFDTPQSMDHNWGPHIRIFLREEEIEAKQPELDKMFRQELPVEFMGFPTNYTEPDETKYLVQQMKPIKKGPVNHMIQFYTIKGFFEHFTGFDPYQRITYRDWLTFPQQALIEVTAGELYHDDIGFQKIRDKFSYFPEPVWRYIYMIQWEKVGNIEAFIGRSGAVGDELGSSINTAQIIYDIMKLCFVIEKKYIPYRKWFGTAFSHLECANDLTGPLLAVIRSKDWKERDEQLGEVYKLIAKLHNQLKITKPIKPSIGNFHGRPYTVIRGLKVRDAILETIEDPFFRDLKYKLGALDQWIDHAIITRMEYVYKELKEVIK